MGKPFLALRDEPFGFSRRADLHVRGDNGADIGWVLAVGLIVGDDREAMGRGFHGYSLGWGFTA
jgi:hypothetical protein